MTLLYTLKSIISRYKVNILYYLGTKIVYNISILEESDIVKRKIILTIMDGIALREEEHGNAFKLANTPNLNRLMSEYGFSKLDASGEVVGLPAGQMGNSEVGHTNIGAGRIVLQPLEYINQKIKDNSLYQNQLILDIFNHVKANNSKLHIMGLLSDGGVHSHINHIVALLNMCKLNNISKVYIHCFMDGRDTKVDSGIGFIKELEDMIKEYGVGTIATIVGRFYAMDRDKRWERVEEAYKLLVSGVGDKYDSPTDALISNYKNNITDEFIRPSLINSNGLIEDNDAIIHANFRPDRVKELAEVLTNKDFNFFPIKLFNNLKMITLMKTTNLDAAYELDELNNTLGLYLANNNKKQLRIAETEKYAHVTYFFDGGIDVDLPNCKRILVPSSKVVTYDLEPKMKAYEITNELIKEMENDYDFILINYANGDMVGHTGNMDATIKAIEAVDENIGILEKRAKELGYTLIITADHGNAEDMIDENNKIITAHSTNRVPFIVCDKKLMSMDGKLGDIAPSILKLMDLKIPNEMTGKIIIKKRGIFSGLMHRLY